MGWPAFVEYVFLTILESKMEAPEISCFVAMNLSVCTNTIHDISIIICERNNIIFLQESTLPLKDKHILAPPTIFAVNCG